MVDSPGALKDAKLFRDAVISLGLTSEQNVVVLENPTLAKLKAEPLRYVMTLSIQDRFLIYYSGHGYASEGKMYLTPSDVDASFIQMTSYCLSDELPKLLAQTKSQDVVMIMMIMDACYGGSIVVDKPLVGARVEKASLEEFAKNRGAIFLLSSGPEERSQEKPEGGG